MKISEIKQKDLRLLSVRKWDEVKKYEKLYLIPSGKKHDSGFALMYIVGVNGKEMEIAATCDDVCWDFSKAQYSDVRNDMLYPSGIVQYWSNKFYFEVGHSLSSTNVCLVEKNENK